MNQNKLTNKRLLEMIEIEDSCVSVSVGGLAAEIGLLSSKQTTNPIEPIFGRFIELARRNLGMTLEELADKADIDLAEIVAIESHDDTVPNVRTVFNLAKVLNLPSGNLLEVAQLAKPRPELSNAALKFAARSESTAALSDAERAALEEFVKVLIEGTDGE